jgi:superfamily II DNA or RNA helicase
LDVIISGLVWLPRSELTDRQIGNLKSELTIQPKRTTDISVKEEPAPIFLFDDDEERGLFGIPRGYYLRRKSGENNETLDISYGKPMRKLKTIFRATGPYQEQETAIEELQMVLSEREWGGAILHADPGFGKTVAGLELARRVGRRTLILVHRDFLVKQWIKRIKKFMPDANVGIIQQKKCEYDVIDKTQEIPDFVIGMNDSLASDISKYPKEMYSAFGLVIEDEVHRTGAPTWSKIISRFNAAYRLGMSADMKRPDGAHDVFFYHISPITYSAKTKMMTPRLRKLYSTTTLKPIDRGKYKVSVKNLNSAQVTNQLVSDKFRTRNIVDDIILAVKEKRKLLVLSERLEHLKEMSEMLGSAFFDMKLSFVPTIDFYTGDWFTGEVWTEFKRSKSGKILHRKGEFKKRKRTDAELDKAETANVIFATVQMVKEALDIPALDAAVFATPIGDVKQAVGRIQRWCFPDTSECKRLCPWRAGECKGKPDPIVTEMVDKEELRLLRKFKRKEPFYRKIGALEKGKK